MLDAKQRKGFLAGRSDRLCYTRQMVQQKEAKNRSLNLSSWRAWGTLTTQFQCVTAREGGWKPGGSVFKREEGEGWEVVNTGGSLGADAIKGGK